MENKITPALKESLLSKLCWYDKRNPDCLYDDEDIEDHKQILKNNGGQCYCDNCFYGRTPLAEQILKLLGE